MATKGQSGRHVERFELADRAIAKLIELLEGGARRELFLLLVGRQARGRAWLTPPKPSWIMVV